MHQNKFAPLVDQDEDSLDAINDNLNNVISESALVVGGTAPRQETGKLPRKIKDLIKKRRSREVSN